MRVSDDYEERVRASITGVLGHLLYIASEDSDQEVRYVPTGRTKRAGRVSDSTVHDVGVTVGRAIGERRVVYVGGGGDGERRSPRAHMRAGHWHHYWTGPRESHDRRLVVRWVAPTMVGSGSATTTTTHAAK